MRSLFPFLIVLLVVSLSAATPARAKSGDFAAWKQQFAKQLRKEGLAEPAIALFLDSAQYLEAPVRAQGRQPEKMVTFGAYRRNLLTDARISEGQQLLRDYRPYFEQLAQSYGVEPQLFIALWGIESSYGRSMGRHPLISSLASLAYAGKRQAFFEKQLVAAVRIAASGDIAVERMTGSWAGAMGHYQFIPTTFERFGIDGDGDRRCDILGSYADAAASAGNYLQQIGWRIGDARIRQVDERQARRLFAREKQSQYHTAAHWQKAGLFPATSADRTALFKLVAPDEGRSGYFLVGEGFDKLKEWNRSTYFALTVLLLAEKIAGGPDAR
jgi:membrane-bound lytic murein transglycosylase B